MVALHIALRLASPGATFFPGVIESAAPPGGASVTDDFNRAGPALGANWTNYLANEVTIYASTTVIGVDGQYCAAGYTGETFAANQYSYAVISNAAVGVGVAVRMSSTGCYEFDTDGSYMYFNRFYGNYGSHSALTGDDTPITVGVGDTLKITVSGTTITCYVNSTQVAQTTDANISSGVPGIMMSGGSNANRLDNFMGGDL